MSERAFDPSLHGEDARDVNDGADHARVTDAMASRIDARQRLSTTTHVMRFGGALLLTAAASSFMLQHWQHGDSATRYAYLLAHTLLLALSGIVCGVRVRESRAARTFFALVLASTPVHFAVLGGMLRSVFPVDGAAGPRDLWPMHSVPLALGLLALGLALLVPLVHLAQLTLARPCARALTSATLAMNAFLLLPWRAPSLTAVLCGAMLAALLALDARALRVGYAARTPQARFARALLAAPIAIAALRAAIWYHPTLIAYGAFAMCSGLALFFAAPRLLRSSGASGEAQACAALGAAVGATCMAFAIHLHALPTGLALPLHFLPGCALLGLLSCRAQTLAAEYRLSAALIAGVTLALSVIVGWEADVQTWSAALALGVGSAILAGGVYARQRLVFGAGALPALLGFAQLLVASIEFEHLRNWATLSVIGAVLIFAAALLERHADRLLHAARALTTRLSDW